MIKSICVISPGYPSKERPYEFTFVDQLVCALAGKGINICVITPHDAVKTRAFSTRIWNRHTQKGNTIRIFSPAVITLSTRKIGFVNMSLVSEKLFNRSVNQILDKYHIQADILYAHFLFKSGACAASIGNKRGIPSVCAFGESSLWSIREIGLKGARKRLRFLQGVIAVSSNNKSVLIENKLVDKDKIIVIPNAVNKNVFFPGDKKEARKRLGIPENKIIGVYNGSFSFQKGALRVAEAASKIEGLSMVYLGGGREEPKGPNIIFKGKVSHKEVPVWLRAADFFVLPTLEEGCCNAVIEAMSTGLPIITSDKAFNYDILDSDSALLIDPLDINELQYSMRKLVVSAQMRQELGEAALRKSEKLDIEIRAEKILHFLNSLKC